MRLSRKSKLVLVVLLLLGGLYALVKLDQWYAARTGRQAPATEAAS